VSDTRIVRMVSACPVTSLYMHQALLGWAVDTEMREVVHTLCTTTTAGQGFPVTPLSSHNILNPCSLPISASFTCRSILASKPRFLLKESQVGFCHGHACHQHAKACIPHFMSQPVGWMSPNHCVVDDTSTG
jgi:hypothetical protein